MKKSFFTIGRKIFGGFILLIIIFTVNAAYSIFTIDRNNQTVKETAEVINPSTKAIHELNLLITESKMLITNWVYLQNNQEDKQALKELQNSRYPELKDKITGLAQQWEDKAQIQTIDSVLAGFESLIVIEKEIMSSLISFENYEDPMLKLLAEETVESEILPRTNKLKAQLNRIGAIKKQEEDQAQLNIISSSEELKSLILILGVITIVIGIVGSMILTNNITKPINKVRTTIINLSKGILPDSNKSTKKFSHDEIGEMGYAVEELVEGLRATSDFAENIGKGNYKTEFTPLSEQDVLGNSLIGMRDNLQKVAEDDRRRNWATEGTAKFGEILRQNNHNVTDLANIILSSLVKYMKANQGGLYVIENETAGEESHMTLEACYAWDKRKYIEQKIYKGEGLAGQSWQEKDTIYITDVPEEYITITSGLGDASPTSILIVPLMVNDEVYGAIELASFNEFNKFEIEFMEKIAESIASSISSAKINVKTQLLLKESQQMTEQMQSQEEEMRQNMEELQATQEEMYRKQKETELTLQEAKSREERYKESEGRLQIIINNLPKFIFWKDKDLKFMGCNNAFAQVAGLSSPAEIVGKTDFDFWKNEAQAYRADDLQVINTKQAKLNYEEPQTDGEGKETWSRVSKVPLLDKAGEVIGILGMFEDVTEQKEQIAEWESTTQRLHQTEEELKQILQVLQEKGVEIPSITTRS